MTHENNNIGGGAEHPGSDEQKISAMLTGLKRVEAPKDFDFHLKARIAKVRPADHRQTSLFPILKYAMPLALFLFVGAGIFIYSSYSEGPIASSVQAPDDRPISNSVPTGINRQPVSPVPGGTETVATANPPASGVTPQKVSEPRAGSVEAPRRASSSAVNSGGSRDFTTSSTTERVLGNSKVLAVKESEPALNPPGIELNAVGVAESLKKMDAEARFENGVWTIKSLKPNGIAEQIGMRAGDRLIKIDGDPVGERTVFDKAFTARTIEVQRGDATVELNNARKP